MGLMAGKGRKRLENKLIENPSSRMVCFSKRHKGLFKKVEELSVLSGAKVTALAFSQAGKPYCSNFQNLDSLLCPPAESTFSEAMAANSVFFPQLGTSTEKEVEEAASGSAFAEAMAAYSFPSRQYDMSVEAMVEELYSSEVPTINPLFCSEIDGSNSAFTDDMDENLFCPDVETITNPLFCPQFNVSAENEAENGWKFDFAKAMAGKELPFWYNRANVQAMGCEELLRLRRAITEYGEMQFNKNYK